MGNGKWEMEEQILRICLIQGEHPYLQKIDQ